MRLNLPVLASVLSLLADCTHAGAWSFEDATLSVSAKGSGAGEGSKQTLKVGASLPAAVELGPSDTLKINLKATENKTPKRPHQAFLTLQETDSGLEDSFPLTVQENGKATIGLTYKDLPAQFLSTTQPLKASLVLASFGSSDPLESHAFDLSVTLDQNTPAKVPLQAVRYGKLDEIHHIFKYDPQSPPRFITMIFFLQAVIALFVLFGLWAAVDANLSHLPEAFSNAPISHTLFFGSILTLEGLFFLYYTHWKLYQMLPAVGAVGIVAFLSGSRALSEVQARRLSGKR